MQVVEIFQSIQGEGTLLGTQMIFVRLWGCNMSCKWCDTTYAWSPEFKEMTKRKDYTPEQLTVFLQNNFPRNVEWVNFTGGEPTLWADDLIEVTNKLSKKICIQTNGIKWIQMFFSKLDKICMDFKCPSSGEESNLDFLRKLKDTDEAKFVISDSNDLNYAKKVLRKYETKATIIIQPVLHFGEDFDSYYNRIRWIINELRQIDIKNVRITPQFHQLLWRDEIGK